MEKEYWENYYKTFNLKKPSNFAEFCLPYMLESKHRVIDVGCGNARDSFYFASQGLDIIGIEQCEVATASNDDNKNKNGTDLKLEFIKDDFTSYDYSTKVKENFSIYSRFTLHAINYEEEKSFFKAILDAPLLSYLFIEARTIRDSIYGDGKEMGKHEFMTSHYRRFIDPDTLKELLENEFQVLHFSESTGYSKTEEEDPCLVRVIAKRF